MIDTIFSSPHERFDIDLLGKLDGQDRDDIDSLFGQLYPEAEMGDGLIADQDTQSYIAARIKETGRIAGLVELNNANGQTYMANLVVDIEERRKGVGEAMVRLGIDSATQHGSRLVLALMQFVDFPEPAERLLTRLGFTPSTRMVHASSCMELVLDEA